MASFCTALGCLLGIGMVGLQAATPPDVLVVGAGIGGLATSLDAARRGARVMVVDQSSVFGGHAVASEGGLCLIGTPEQKAQGIEDSPDLAYEDFVRWGEDANREWARIYADHALTEVHDWLAAMGVKFTFWHQFPRQFTGGVAGYGKGARGRWHRFSPAPIPPRQAQFRCPYPI